MSHIIYSGQVFHCKPDYKKFLTEGLDPWDVRDEITGCDNPREGKRRIFNWTRGEVIWIASFFTREQFLEEMKKTNRLIRRERWRHEYYRARLGRLERMKEEVQSRFGVDPSLVSSELYELRQDLEKSGTFTWARTLQEIDLRIPTAAAKAKAAQEEAAARRQARIDAVTKAREETNRITTAEVNGKVFTRPELEAIWEEEYQVGIKKKGRPGKYGKHSRRNAAAESGAFRSCSFYWRDSTSSRGTSDRNTTFKHTGTGQGWNEGMHPITWAWCQDWHQKFTKRSIEDYIEFDEEDGS